MNLDNITLTRWIWIAFTFVAVTTISGGFLRLAVREWSKKRARPEVETELKLPAHLFALGLGYSIALHIPSEILRGNSALLASSKLVLVIALVTGANRGLGLIFTSNRLEKTALQTASKNLLLTLSRVMLFSLGTLIALDTVGITITPLLASLGVGSLAVALALQDALANFFSGIYLTVDKPFLIGDFIRIDNQEGEVISIGWRTTHIRLASSNIVVMPNKNLAQGVILNYSMPSDETPVSVEMAVDYVVKLDWVEKLVVEVARHCQQTVIGAVRDYEPIVRFHTFGSYSINFTTILRANKISEQGGLKHAFIKNIHRAFKEAGIQIPLPHQVVHEGDPPRADSKDPANPVKG